MIRNKLKGYKKRLISRQGSDYVGTTVFIMIMMILLIFIMTVAPVFLRKMTMNNYANELCREAEIAGRVGEETTERLDRLNESTGLNPDVSWSRNGRIQIGETYAVTGSTQVDLSFFIFTSVPITVSSTVEGTSEVFWK